MYAIIPLLLAHIQELNKQILSLFNFIVKNIPLKFKEKDDSLFSPKYNKLKVDKLPLIKVPEKKDYRQLLKQSLEEHDKPLNEVPELEKVELMPAKWQVLIELSQQLILQQQKT